MSTLLLRLAAPLQSWGIDGKFENRRGTERIPTKSGVIGLLAAALGRRRYESIDDLRSLRFGVRVDREGILLRDYHTAKSQKAPYVTHRYYLADAVFLAGLEGDERFLDEIEDSLRHPVFPLFLGRRSCPPEGKISLGIRRGTTLMDALGAEPWLGGGWPQRRQTPPAGLRIVIDADKDRNGYFRRDSPLSFDQSHRKHGFRRISDSVLLVAPGSADSSSALEKPTEHDPMSELEE